MKLSLKLNNVDIIVTTELKKFKKEDITLDTMLKVKHFIRCDEVRNPVYAIKEVTGYKFWLHEDGVILYMEEIPPMVQDRKEQLGVIRSFLAIAREEQGLTDLI